MYTAIFGGSAAAILIVITLVSGWCLWSRRRRARKLVKEPGELEDWQVGASEQRNTPENYYATMRPGTWTASDHPKALDESKDISENYYATMRPGTWKASDKSKALDVSENKIDTSQPNSDDEGIYTN